MSSVFNLERSLERAQKRFGGASDKAPRRHRSDRGRTRLDPRIVEWLAAALGGYDHPSMTQVLAEVTERCREAGISGPSRAAVYNLLLRLPTPRFLVSDLPAAVRAALYNFEPGSRVPAHQIAFHCFNYGDTAAMSFAASLPWLALYQALRLPGYRAKSFGLAQAVALVRGI